MALPHLLRPHSPRPVAVCAARAAWRHARPAGETDRRFLANSPGATPVHSMRFQIHYAAAQARIADAITGPEPPHAGGTT